MSIFKVTPLRSPGTRELRGRPRIIKDRPRTAAERKQSQRARNLEDRIEQVAVMDFETDPFDAESDKRIFPFAAGFYSNDIWHVIWNEDEAGFVDDVINFIESLPGKYTIYAHNGGKFDFMFLLHKLRGRVSFKGRGIMAARIGEHELRDSFHIIPEKLANWKKDDFDYSLLLPENRNQHKDKIIKYMMHDCEYLHEIVVGFLKEFGFKISIGQAAMAELQKSYSFERLGETADEYMREFFFGGRVECLQGIGHFKGNFKLYDVNSMYPYVMAEYLHPTGADFTVHDGEPTENTFFIELECENFGAFVRRDENNFTTAETRNGVYRTTIYEYRVAEKYGLMEDIKIKRCIDFGVSTSFPNFVLPRYEKRQETKHRLKYELKPGTPEYDDCKKDNTFLKLILNNAYGKFAQNPRKYKEYYMTSPDGLPPADQGYEEMPMTETEEYCIWQKPLDKLKFNNVATAASITGAARSVLLDAIMRAKNPIYCDTDSIICEELSGVTLDAERLGAWDLEKELSEVVICGKKMYAYKDNSGDVTTRSKGISGLTWGDYFNMLDNQIIEKILPGVTLTKDGGQFYMRRNIRSTGAARNIQSATYKKVRNA